MTDDRSEPFLPEYAPTLPNVIRQSVQDYGNRDFLIAEDQRLTFADADRESAHLARGLLAAGIRKGTRVGIIMPNNPDWVLSWFAAARIGAFTIPLSTFFQSRELSWALRNDDIDTLLICDHYLNNDYLEMLERALPGLEDQQSTELYLPSHPYLRRIIVWGENDTPSKRQWAMKGPHDLAALADSHPQIDDAYLAEVESNVFPADLLVMISTSGSTAEPKGVVHTHGSTIRTTHAFRPYMDIAHDDRIYTGMPFFWIGGLNVNLLQVMYEGACMVFSPSPKPADILDVVERERVTHVGAWAPQLLALREQAASRDRDLSFIRVGFSEPTDADGNVIPLDQRPAGMMGMTESFGMHSIEKLHMAASEGKAGNWGRRLPGVERKIVDPATGAALPAGREGELYIRGFSLMQGYYKKEREETFTSDGFFPTGDLSIIDEDNYIYFNSRRSEMIKTSGANVAPREVEALLQSYDEIREAIVFGIPDTVKEELVIAIVIPADGASIDPTALRDQLRQEISAYKVPNTILVREQDDVPRTDSGKPIKPQLRKLIAKELAR